MKDSECEHDWTDMYTDRDSPQSYIPGKGYRGFRIVGRRCLKCNATELKGDQDGTKRGPT